jgi:hypothetical protein
MCESFGVLEVSRWPILAVGLLLVVGSLELGWKSRRIALLFQRSLKALDGRPLLRMFSATAGGFFGPEFHRMSMIFTAAVGLLVGVFLLALGICSKAAP